MLVLLNGPPASGKSTIAARLADVRPLALNLDIDVVRGQLGRWLDDTTEAGLAARALALSMVRTHLSAGHDVFVPQFLARPGLAEQLAEVASECHADFVPIALVIPRETARAAFAARSTEPTDRTHRDAASMVDRASTPDPVGEMFDRFSVYLDDHPSVHRVDAVRGEIEAVVREVERVIADTVRHAAPAKADRPPSFAVSHAPADYPCPFCRNVIEGTGAFPLEIVHRNDDVIVKVNPNWWPNNPGGVLVIPTEHHENIFDLPDRFAEPLHRAARDVAVAMKVAFGCDGVSTRQHNEPAGNQEVWHYHLHVFPRWDSDGLYGSRNALAPEAELRARAQQLRAAWPAE